MKLKREIIIWTASAVLFICGVAVAIDWSDYDDFSAGQIDNADTFLVRDKSVPEGSPSRTTVKEYPWSVMKADIATIYGPGSYSADVQAALAAANDAALLAEIGAEPAQTPVTEEEAEAGTEEAIRSWSPYRVAQAIAALAASGLVGPDNLTGDTVDDGLVDKAIIGNSAKSVSQAASLGDNGELTPTAGYFLIDVALTCTADDADIVMIETGAIEGAIAIITNVSAANTCRFNDSAGVSELKTTVASLEPQDVMIFRYSSTPAAAWYEIGRSQATLHLLAISSAVPFTDGATGGAYVKLNEDSDNGTDSSQIQGAADAGTNPSWTFKGSAAGSEDFTVTATANTMTVSTSTGVTLFSFGSIQLAGGSLTPVVDDADNFAANFAGANLYGGTFIANAAGTAALPAAGVGMNFTIVLEAAAAVILNPDTAGTADTIVMNGLAAAQDENITSSTLGAMCVFQYRAADSWMATCNGFAEATPP